VRRYFCDRVVPADLFVGTAALWPATTQGSEQSIRVIHAIEEPIDLRAKSATRDGVLGIALEFGGNTV
jgi:hypothetical protein